MREDSDDRRARLGLPSEPIGYYGTDIDKSILIEAGVLPAPPITDGLLKARRRPNEWAHSIGGGGPKPEEMAAGNRKERRARASKRRKQARR